MLDAVFELGGSASVDEISERIISKLGIPDDLANTPHSKKPGTSDSRTRLEYDLAWVRTTLKQLGHLANSTRGVWTMTELARKTPKLSAIRANTETNSPSPHTAEGDWYADLAKVLQEKLSPSAFERLVQRVLRETGFSQVEVLGRTNDGGIDGRGVARINGILSFRVVFQCKRYKGSVGASEIRDFRGAMVGRADKGLFITTGAFTREAQREAVRDGAPAVDLVDGVKLAEKLKEFSLGIRIATTETVHIDDEWFGRL